MFHILVTPGKKRKTEKSLVKMADSTTMRGLRTTKMGRTSNIR